MNLRHLAVFHAVAKTGSVNAAAPLLRTSQPAVSRELQTLEGRLGMPLFDRLPRGMRLTEAGQVLLSYAERIFGIEQAAERAMRELADLESGQLAIGASNTIGTYLLPGFIARYHRRYPRIRLSLEIGNTEEVVKGIHDARFTLAFVEGSVHDETLEVREIRRDRIVAVAAPVHPLVAIGPVSLQALAETPALLREHGSGTREVFDRAAESAGIAVHARLELGHTEAVMRAVMAGAGLGCLSRFVVEDAVRRGELAVLPAPFLELRRPLHAVLHKARFLGPALRATLQACGLKLE